MEKARLGMLHQVPEALRQLLKEAGFEWAAWNASWRHALSGAQVTFAELRDHLDEAWLRQRIAESLRAARRPLPSGSDGAASSVSLESDREAQRMYEVDLLSLAAQQFADLPADVRLRLMRRIDQLRSDPIPPDGKGLNGSPTLRRIREGEQRLVYEVDPAARRLTLILIGQELRTQAPLLRQLEDIMSFVGDSETLRRLAAEVLEDAADAREAQRALASTATQARLSWMGVGGVEAGPSLIPG